MTDYVKIIDANVNAHKARESLVRAARAQGETMVTFATDTDTMRKQAVEDSVNRVAEKIGIAEIMPPVAARRGS